MISFFYVALGASTIQYATAARSGAPTIQQLQASLLSQSQQQAAAAAAATKASVSSSTNKVSQFDGLDESSDEDVDEDDYRDNDDDQEDNDDEMNDEENDGGIEDEVRVESISGISGESSFNCSPLFSYRSL